MDLHPGVPARDTIVLQGAAVLTDHQADHTAAHQGAAADHHTAALQGAAVDLHIAVLQGEVAADLHPVVIQEEVAAVAVPPGAAAHLPDQGRESNTSS
jgi:hypothetical protein